MEIKPDDGYSMTLDARDVKLPAEKIGIDFLPTLLAEAKLNASKPVRTIKDYRHQRVTIYTALETLTTYVGNLEDAARGIDTAAAERFMEEQG